MKTVSNIIIGKDVDRTASVSVGTSTANSTIVEGEVVVLDSNGQLLAAGSTVADTPYIEIAVAKETFTFVNPSGNTITHRKLKKSGKIFASDVVSYRGLAYSAPANKVVRVTGLTPSTSYETVLTLVYTDKRVEQMTPGYMIQDFRITATGSTPLANWTRRVAAKVNGDPNSRITAAAGTTYLTLTAKAAPDQTLNDIDEHFVVDFEVKVKEIPTGITGPQVPASTTIATTTESAVGHGTWQQVRDLEKAHRNYDGIVNTTTFPIPSGVTEWLTVKDETYNAIVIKHDNKHHTSDMGYVKPTNQATYVYIPNNAGNQMADVLDKLNTYLGSVGFDNVSF